MSASAAPVQAVPRTWLAVLVTGIVIAVVGGVLGYTAVHGLLSEPILTTPGTVTESAHAGDYLLYAQSGTEHHVLGVTTSNTYEPGVQASAFSLTEDGTPLTLTSYDSHVSQTEQRGSRVFVAVASVHVPRSGRLTLTVRDDEGAVILGPSVTGTFGRVVAGVLVGLVGVVLIGASLVLRHRAQVRVLPRWGFGPTGYGWQPPGWTPPPAASWPPPAASPAAYLPPGPRPSAGSYLPPTPRPTEPPRP